VTFHWNFAEDGERIKRLRGISIFSKVFKLIQGDRFFFCSLRLNCGTEGNRIQRTE
jgi:hypothetical protein